VSAELGELERNIGADVGRAKGSAVLAKKEGTPEGEAEGGCVLGTLGCNGVAVVGSSVGSSVGDGEGFSAHDGEGGYVTSKAQGRLDPKPHRGAAVLGSSVGNCEGSSEGGNVGFAVGEGDGSGEACVLGTDDG
jgi:hypothetical protein